MLRRVLQAISVLAIVAIIGSLGVLFNKNIEQADKSAVAREPLNAQELLKINTVLVEAETTRGSGAYIGGSLILTAAHVCVGALGNIEKLSIVLYQGAIVNVKSYIISDRSDTDLCLIEADQDLSLYLTGLKLGAKATMMLGSEGVMAGFAGGSAYTERYFKVTKQERMAFKNDNGTLDILELAETTALTIPGMSGGPVLNMRGELIGIVVAWIYPNTSGVATTKQIHRFLEEQGEGF